MLGVMWGLRPRTQRPGVRRGDSDGPPGRSQERTPGACAALLSEAVWPGSAVPAAVDVVDLVVLVECYGLHAVREGPVQDPDT